MKSKCLLLSIAFSLTVAAESVYQQNGDGEYILYTNSIENLVRSMYISLQGWGSPFIGNDGLQDYVYDTHLSEALASDWENQIFLRVMRHASAIGVGNSYFYSNVYGRGTYLNYSNWQKAYLYELLYQSLTNQSASVGELRNLYGALGGLDSPVETPIVRYALPEWSWESWTNYPYSFYGVGNDNATAKQLWADTRYQAQVGNNLDSLYNWGMPAEDLLNTLANPVLGEQLIDGIPARLMEAAGKSMKFHVSLKATSNALHAVLGYKGGSNTLHNAIEEVNANLRGIAANIGAAGGGGEGGGTNEFCCYFGVAWSNFQQRTGIVLPEGVISWDEYLQGWQQDMTQITQSGDDRLRQWWGMMYTQTLLMDRMRRETLGLGGQIARAESLSNSVDRIRDEIDDAIRDSDGWKEQVEFDMARMFVSNVAPRVLEPMENFALGLRGPGQNRKGGMKNGNNEVVLLEWSGLGIRLAFDKTQLEDVADTVRSAIRAFLYVVDMLLILWVGITAFKLVGRAYQWAHSCE